MGIRSIVSFCESPTENISQFLDYWLKPLIKALPSYFKRFLPIYKQNQRNTLNLKPCWLLLILNPYTVQVVHLTVILI